MSDLTKRLNELCVILKSGEYDGVDILAAWRAMSDAASRIEELEEAIRKLTQSD